MSKRPGEFKELMQRVCAGDKGAARELIEKYGSAILAVVRRRMHPRLRSQFDSSDFVQAVWASFFSASLQNYTFEESEMLVRFLLRLANNKVASAIRRRLHKAQETCSLTEGVQGPATRGREPTPSEAAIVREEWQRVTASQPEHLRRLVEARARGKKIQVMADKLGISERTARRLLHRLAARDHHG